MLRIKHAVLHCKCSLYNICSRTAIAAMHFNENSARPQAVNNGQPRFEVYYPKVKKGEASVKVVKTDATFGKLVMSYNDYFITC